MLWVFWHLLQGTPNPDFVTLIEKSEYALTNLGIQHPLHRLGQIQHQLIRYGQNSAFSNSRGGVFTIENDHPYPQETQYSQETQFSQETQLSQETQFSQDIQFSQETQCSQKNPF